MANILNLALKKDVFESLKNNTSNDIFIDNTKYWEKRLVDESGEYKKYDIVKISCGSSEKLEYPISTIALNIENQYMITISRENESVDEVNNEDSDVDIPVESVNDSVEIIPEIVEIKPEPVIEKIIKNTPVKPVKVIPNVKLQAPKNIQVVNHKPVDKEPTIKDIIKSKLDEFCKNIDVYSVRDSIVVIRNNGQIVGTNRKLMVDADNDVVIKLGQIEIVRHKNITDDMFLKSVMFTMSDLLKGNYVFICKNKCGFTKIASGEDVFVLNVASRKKFSFKKR